MPQETVNHTGPRQRPQVETDKDQHRELSDAPPSKAQQQREALKKLSQALSNEMDDSSVDLEQVLLRILASTTDHDSAQAAQPDPSTDRSNKVPLTKSDAIKATQMISNLIKSSPGSAFSQPRKAPTGLQYQ
jgi:hypothetical protein